MIHPFWKRPRSPFDRPLRAGRKLGSHPRIVPRWLKQRTNAEHALAVHWRKQYAERAQLLWWQCLPNAFGGVHSRWGCPCLTCADGRHALGYPPLPPRIP